MDVVKILEKLESLGYIRLNKIINKYYSCYCPFHNDGNERKPSFGVLMQEEYRNGRKYPQGFCHCFTCSYAKTLPEMVTDILKLHNINQSGMDWLVANIPGFESQSDFEFLIPEDLMQSVNSKYAVDYVRSLTSKTQIYVSEEELASYRFTVPYMYERKLTNEIIEKFDVGVDMNWIPPNRKKPVPCITFPVHDKNGKTVFICRRSIGGKLFNIPTDSVKPVYGIDMIPKGCKSVVICESCINALTAWVYGYVAVALLGTGTPYQIQQLKESGVTEFIICTDGDDAGRRSAAKLRRNLSGNALIWEIHMPDGKDLNDCTKEEFDILYSNRD